MSVSVWISISKHQQDSNINDCQNNNACSNTNQTLPHVQQQDKYKDKSHLQHVHAD
jgi:hypothetical protein